MLISRDVVTIIPTLPAAYASGVLTSDNTNVADGETVTIGTRVYTFKTALTDGIVANEILIGASADASLTNLANAINGAGTPGTDYGSATTVNSQVTSGAVASHTITLTAKSAGQAGTSIATTETSAHLSFGSATLDGGEGGAVNTYTLDKAQAFTTDSFDLGYYTEAIAFLNVRSHAGTNPTLDIKFQFSPDNINWMDSGDSFTQVTTGDTVTLKRFTSIFGRYCRAVITPGGTLPVYVVDLTIVAKG